MMNSYASACLKKGKTYSALGGVALIAILSSTSWLHALKSPEEIEEANHVRCLWHLDEKAQREAALETLKKRALTGKWQAHLRYLKKVAEFLKEDPSYRPVTAESPTGASQSDESPTTFFESLHTQALSNLSSSDLSPLEKDFESIRLNFFHDRVKKRLSGETEGPVGEDLISSLRALQSTPGINKGLLLRVRFFQNYYLSNKPDKDKLEEIADTAIDTASTSESHEERMSLRRLTSRIHFKLAESVPFDIDSQKRQSRRQNYFRRSARFGNGLAKFHLAEIYNNETSGFYDAQAAFELYVDSANEGCSLASHKLASFFESGNEKLHISQDQEKALEWHRRAAKTHPFSQYILGKHLLEQGQAENVEEGLHLVRQSAEHRYSSAQLLLGQYYKEGQFVDQDSDLAFQWLNNAAEQNEIPAYYPTAYALEKGIGTTVDYEKALKFYKLAAKYDDPNALLRLGKLFLKGRGLERPSEAMALSYFQQASQHGSMAGRYHLGMMHLLGQGVEKPDPDLAFTLLKEAADEGHEKASEKVGVLSQFGLGTTQNFEEIRKAYEKSNTANSLYHLGWLHKRGLGVEQDSLQALSLWEKAADLGNPFAAYRAGKAHLKMWKEGENDEDEQKAYQYLSQASESMPDAMYLLGYLQKKGIGCDEDAILAMESYKKAAERGHAKAQFKVGQYVEESADEGWESESFSWYEKAALQGHQKAQSARFRFHFEGIGCSSDIDLAFNSFGSDENQINPSKLNALKQLIRERRHEQSLKFIEQKADKDNIPALLFMAKITEEGTLVPQDTSKAISLYQRAWEKGNRSAYLRLKDLEQSHVLKTLGIEINL
ncbi:MAG: sel1 repeat family protein [Alphaproteobacteria bacterium]|nr:sel1 repeat family protein [Alphaproteobacteria bacterium]